MADTKELHPRIGDKQTICLKNAITDPPIMVGDYTTYSDFINDPVGFERNNVLYHYSISHDHLIMGKFCSTACGAKSFFSNANHALSSLSTCPFPLFFEEWGLEKGSVGTSWDNKGDIVIGNDIWIGYEAVATAGVMTGDKTIVGSRVVVTKDAPSCTTAGGVPAKPTRKRYSRETVATLLKLK